MESYSDLIKKIKAASKKEGKTLLLLVANNVRRRRKQLDLNQVDVAKMLGMTRTSVTNIEAGIQNISLSQLHLLAVVLETTPMKLVDPMPLFNDPDEILTTGSSIPNKAEGEK